MSGYAVVASESGQYFAPPFRGYDGERVRIRNVEYGHPEWELVDMFKTYEAAWAAAEELNELAGLG